MKNKKRPKIVTIEETNKVWEWIFKTLYDIKNTERSIKPKVKKRRVISLLPLKYINCIPEGYIYTKATKNNPSKQLVPKYLKRVNIQVCEVQSKNKLSDCYRCYKWKREVPGYGVRIQIKQGDATQKKFKREIITKTKKRTIITKKRKRFTIL